MLTKGLFDLQVNGYAGVDFNDVTLTPADIDRAMEAMLDSGVTGCLPTLITAPLDILRERFRVLDAAVRESRLGRSMIPGYHLEGPFLNPAEGYAGCHPAEAMLEADVGLVLCIEEGLSRPILLATLAPERPGAIDLAKSLLAMGKTVSMGHSAAGFKDVRAAADAGVSLSTHLGNGLPQQLPKLENTVLAQLAEPRLRACLIADGCHMSPEALGALITLKGIGNCILVTDAVSAAAGAAGNYQFADMEVVYEGEGAAFQPGKSHLAGSALSLDDAVRNIEKWGIADPSDATRMASRHPRAAIARSLARYGISLDAGEVSWNSALEPKVLSRGGVTA